MANEPDVMIVRLSLTKDQIAVIRAMAKARATDGSVIVGELALLGLELRMPAPKHGKNVRGHPSLLQLAYEIAGLRYDRVACFLGALMHAFDHDADADAEAKRPMLANVLNVIAFNLRHAKRGADRAWAISAPFMTGERRSPMDIDAPVQVTPDAGTNSDRQSAEADPAHEQTAARRRWVEVFPARETYEPQPEPPAQAVPKAVEGP